MLLVQTGTANAPSILSTSPAMTANTNRAGWSIQNLSTNVLYVRLGTAASTSIFHFALKAGTSNDDGTGGSVSQTDGTVYNGIISIAGSTPRYTVLEIVP